jgi:hypothetical protein
MAKFIELAQGYEQNRGFTHKLVMSSTDVIALTSGTAYSIIPNSSRVLVAAASATTFPAGVMVRQCVVKVNTAFASTLNTITLTLALGDGGSTGRFFTATSVKTAGYPLTPPLATPYLYLVADTIDAIFTAGTEAITVLTAGEVEAYFEIFDCSTLGNPRSSVG